MSLTGSNHKEPIKSGVPISDLSTGMFAIIGILTALRNKEATGKGEKNDISMLDCQASLLNYIATMHLISGKDNSKDQSYFLCQLNQYQLSKTIFPIGSLTKKHVRKIAKDNNLITAEKKDSQGLCFIGKVKLPDFLQQKLRPKKGDVVLIDKNHKEFVKNSDLNDIESLSKPYCYDPKEGKIIGLHNGAHFYTIGQRKGLSIGGMEKPLYVINNDVKKNIIYVGEGSNHPGLFRSVLRVSSKKIHFLSTEKQVKNKKELKARIRYRQGLQDVSVIKKDNFYYFKFKKPQKSITKGQFIALYQNMELICSGVID